MLPPLNSFPSVRSKVKLVSAETIQGNTVCCKFPAYLLWAYFLWLPKTTKVYPLYHYSLVELAHSATNSNNKYIPLQSDLNLRRKNYLLPTQTCLWLDLFTGWFFFAKQGTALSEFEILNFIFLSYFTLSFILILQKSLKRYEVYLY